MKKNLGTTDKIIRVIIALAIGVLYFLNVISGVLAIILGILALIFVITSFLRFCGIYTLFGVNTCPVKNNKEDQEAQS